MDATSNPSNQSMLNVTTALAVADHFKILSDPTRIRILAALSERELCVSEITELLDMEQSAISHQLRTLRGLQLVKHRKVGRQVYYHLNDRYISDLLIRSLAYINQDQRTLELV